jgi:hypothetical protein
MTSIPDHLMLHGPAAWHSPHSRTPGSRSLLAAAGLSPLSAPTRSSRDERSAPRVRALPTAHLRGLSSPFHHRAGARRGDERGRRARARPVAARAEPRHIRVAHRLIAGSRLPPACRCRVPRAAAACRRRRYCYPLTLTDAASRYILACEAFEQIDGLDVRRVLEDVFSTMGLPSAIRFDGGAPFASTGLARLSKLSKLSKLAKLSAWWLSLGIKLEQTEPASPEQKGRHASAAAGTVRRVPQDVQHGASAKGSRCAALPTCSCPRRARSRPCRSPATRCTTSPSRSRRPDTCGCQALVQPLTTSSRRASLVTPSACARLADDCWLVSFCDLDLGVIDRGARRFVAGPVATEVP